jgi:hypothetical protein
MRATILAGLLATALVAGSCGDDEPTEPVDPVRDAAAVGTYTLTTVNATALPFKYGQSDTSRFDIVSGKITLESNHDVTRETVTTETRLSNGAPIGVEAVQRHLGTWLLRGTDSVRFNFPGLETRMAAINATTVTLATGANSLIYTK